MYRSCSVCGQLFNRVLDLKHHVSELHKLAPYTVEVEMQFRNDAVISFCGKMESKSWMSKPILVPELVKIFGYHSSLSWYGPIPLTLNSKKAKLPPSTYFDLLTRATK